MRQLTIVSTDSVEGNSAIELGTLLKNTIYNDFIKPVFGENGEKISNVKYLGITDISNTSNSCVFGFDFDVNLSVLFRIKCSCSDSAISNGRFTLAYEIIDTREGNNVFYTISNSVALSHVGNSNTGLKIWGISLQIDYMTRGSELKALWYMHSTNFYPGVVIFDSVNMLSDGASENVFGLINTSGLVVYGPTGKYDLLSDIINFSIDDKVYMDQIYVKSNGTIVARFGDIMKIFNDSLGTTVFTEGAYKKLIEVNGVRYRQIAGCYWIEERD